MLLLFGVSRKKQLKQTKNMKMKAILPRRMKKKNKKKGILKVDTIATVDLSHSQSDECTSFSSAEVGEENESSTIMGPDGLLIPRFSKLMDGSALAAFARASSTITGTFTEEELGSSTSTNYLYRPGIENQESKIEHPVVCKRDIFVETVKPLRKRGYKKFVYNRPRIPRSNGGTNANQDKGNYLLTSISTVEGMKHINSSDDITHSKSHADAAPSYSISTSMLFQKSNVLKIETGRITTKELEVMQTNPRRLHNVPSEQHNGRVAKDWGRPPRFTGFNVSPSSTVSSLTMCTDFETPKYPMGSPPASYPQLEGIQEFKEFGGILTSGESEDVVDYSEI